MKHEVSVDEFAGLLPTIKTEYEKLIMQWQHQLERQLDLLGGLMSGKNGLSGSNSKEENE
jgi:hypothetical protein